MLLTLNSSRTDSYYQLAKDGRVFSALSTITGLPAYSATTGQGSPLLWNNSKANGNGVLVIILGVSAGWTTAPSATGALGVTVGSGQTSAPTTTTVVDAVGNLNPSGPTVPQCNVYQKGTVANGGSTIIVTHSVSTAGGSQSPAFQSLNGLIVVPPGCWASIAGAAAISLMVADLSLVWAEIPLQ